MATYSALEWGLAVFVLLVLQLCRPSVASSGYLSTGIIEGVAGWVSPEYCTLTTEDHVAAILGSAGVSDMNGADKPGVLEGLPGLFKVHDRHRPTGPHRRTYCLFYLSVPKLEWCAST